MINTDKLGEVGKLSVGIYGDSIDVEFAVLKKENDQLLCVNTQSIANISPMTAATIAST